MKRLVPRELYPMFTPRNASGCGRYGVALFLAYVHHRTVSSLKTDLSRKPSCVSGPQSIQRLWFGTFIMTYTRPKYPLYSHRMQKLNYFTNHRMNMCLEKSVQDNRDVWVSMVSLGRTAIVGFQGPSGIGEATCRWPFRPRSSLATALEKRERESAACAADIFGVSVSECSFVRFCIPEMPSFSISVVRGWTRDVNRLNTQVDKIVDTTSTKLAWTSLTKQCWRKASRRCGRLAFSSLLFLLFYN